MNPSQSAPVCPTCKGTGVVTTVIKGQVVEAPCAACGGSKHSGPRTK